MLDLLEQVPVPCFIDGKAVSTNKTFDLVDPHSATGHVVYQVAAANEATVDAAVDAAWRAFPSWSQTSYDTRRRIYFKAIEVIKKRIDELKAIHIRETASSPIWADMDYSVFTIPALEETAAAITQLNGELLHTRSHTLQAQMQRKPYGVILGIAPFNAPSYLGMRTVRDAIMAGNTTVLKASEYCPRLQLAIAAIFQEAGLPDGVLNVVHFDIADRQRLTERIIARKEVRKVNFTGGSRNGAVIAEMCGRHLKPSVMELGGKAPFIVLPDADIELAASAAAFGGLVNVGQVCMATDTLLVHEDVVKPFTQALQKELSVLSASPTGGFLRGVYSVQSAKRIDGYVEDAMGKGAQVMAGTKGGRSHNVMQPLVLGGITDEMTLHTEEIFGPLMGLRTWKTDDEVIALANASDYGLSSAIYAKDITRAMRIADQIETGAVHLNHMSIHDEPPLPHGPVRKSGWGRFNSVEGLKEFTYTKIVTIESKPFKYS